MQTFIIPAHGVTNSTESPELSYAQHRLLNEPKPIRLCSSPTGAGKTYAFIKAAQNGHSVFFVVPTQALADDIQQANQKHSVKSVIWDGRQTQQAIDEGKLSWAERKADFTQIQKKGGMIIATLESLANLTVGKPKYQHIHLDIYDLLWRFQHLVFDEAHTLNTRAFGLLHLWITLIAYRHQLKVGAPKLTLLSATHSDLLKKLLQEDYLPAEFMISFDEEISEKPDRHIHGDVQIHVHDDTSILALTRQYAADLLREQGKLLLIYDSLKQITQDESELAQLFCDNFGLQPNEVIMINGQDKHLPRSAGSSGFDAGRYPEKRHRIIIGTSAVEMGVNFAINAAIMEPGLDAAALLQRIGRVARNEQTGFIHISNTQKVKNQHVLRLKACQGQMPIKQLRDHFAPLRQINSNAAKALGSAYWSMLARQDRYLIKAVKQAFTELKVQPQPMPGKLLNSLWQATHLKWRQKTEFEQWLQAVDKELQDVRGFAPTVKIQFKDREPLLYSRDWVRRNLSQPNDLKEDTYIYWDVRDNCLLEKSKPINCVFYSPFGTTPAFSIWQPTGAYQNYLAFLKNKNRRNYLHKPEIKAVYEKAEAFIKQTGLLVRNPDSEGMMLDSVIF